MVDLEFPKDLGVSGCVSVLALVCPETRYSDQVPVIIGTNANLFQRLADLCQGTPESPSAQCFRLQPILSQVFQQKQLSA